MAHTLRNIGRQAVSQSVFGADWNTRIAIVHARTLFSLRVFWEIVIEWEWFVNVCVCVSPRQRHSRHTTTWSTDGLPTKFRIHSNVAFWPEQAVPESNTYNKTITSTAATKKSSWNWMFLAGWPRNSSWSNLFQCIPTKASLNVTTKSALNLVEAHRTRSPIILSNSNVHSIAQLQIVDE